MRKIVIENNQVTIEKMKNTRKRKYLPTYYARLVQ